MYLCWFDDSPKTPIAARIEAGRRAYQERFGTPPRVVLVSEAEENERLVLDSMVALFKPWVRRNNYWFGMEAPK